MIPLLLSNKQALVMCLLMAIVLPILAYRFSQDTEAIGDMLWLLVLFEILLLGCIVYLVHRIRGGYVDDWVYREKKE